VTDREKLRALPLTRLNRKLVSDFLRKTQLAPASQKTNLAMGRAAFMKRQWLYTITDVYGTLFDSSVLRTVSRFLGHTTSSTTERHYATMDQRVELPD